MRFVWPGHLEMALNLALDDDTFSSKATVVARTIFRLRIDYAMAFEA
ncbi:hypothetical protein SAMN05216197_101246 [Pseudomonas graminis]|uniref:Uncharacterized protein n=1 Tax=Pseudomonas graminis TaxID=158627 RepID=A0A1H9YGZ2_9PSED|nr:hypothetical protein SAMN05216197_101246 [Pseudomonas graminis]